MPEENVGPDTQTRVVAAMTPQQAMSTEGHAHVTQNQHSQQDYQHDESSCDDDLANAQALADQGNTVFASDDDDEPSSSPSEEIYRQQMKARDNGEGRETSENGSQRSDDGVVHAGAHSNVHAGANAGSRANPSASADAQSSPSSEPSSASPAAAAASASSASSAHQAHSSAQRAASLSPQNTQERSMDRFDIDNQESEFQIAFDILDQITDLVDDAHPIMFQPGYVKIDRDELEMLVNNLREALPTQLSHASEIMRAANRELEEKQKQGASIVNDANRQAKAMVDKAEAQAHDTISKADQQAKSRLAQAQQQADYLAGQQNVMVLARQKAETVVATAQSQATQIRQGADSYAAQVLGDLSERLSKLSRDVNGGLDVLHQRMNEQN